MAAEENLKPPPALDEWYGHMITPLDRDELSGEEYEEALRVVQMAMAGIQELLAAGKIRNVEVSFEMGDLSTPEGEPYGFNFSVE